MMRLVSFLKANLLFPLPLLSYGGSSLWAFSVMIFIFIALDRQEKKYF